jgi:hypothetical protein
MLFMRNGAFSHAEAHKQDGELFTAVLNGFDAVCKPLESLDWIPVSRVLGRRKKRAGD